MIDLFHCFGANPDHRVDAATAVAMLRASRCRYLAVNTHRVDEVAAGDELTVGYATATLAGVLELVGPEFAVTPVLNINHPTTAREAVRRARLAVELTGIGVIKLEVLDHRLTVADNQAVVSAAAELLADGLEVWPLIMPDPAAYRECVALGSTVVRVMGSPIGARRGIDPEHLPALEGILADHAVPVMLDGGIGSVDDVRDAFRRGFDSVLVNSCLFAEGGDPVSALAEFRTAVDRARAGTARSGATAG